MVTRTEQMSVSKVAGVNRHEKCSWYWLEKRMMAMTRDRLAVGQREDEMANSCMKTHPLSTFVKAAAVNVLFFCLFSSV